MSGILNPRLTDKGKAVLDALRGIEQAREVGAEYDASALPADVREVLISWGELQPATPLRDPRGKTADD